MKTTLPLRLRHLTLGAMAAAVAAISLAFRMPADPAERLVERLLAFYSEAHPEVSYLHLNQAAYAAGETVWFKAYVADAHRHQLDSLSRVLYVDMVSPSGRRVLLRRTLALRGGLAHGDLALPDTLAQGVYTVRAYTHWMRNAGEQLFFSRRVPVWQAAPPAPDEASASTGKAPATRRPSARPVAPAKPDVQFFPEGGDYVAGLPTVVGVKALDATGTGLALRGEILDDQNQVQTTFSTPALGMSAFNFTPAAGRRYYARVALPTGATADYPLPAALPDGWVMNTREIGGSFKVFIRRRAAAGAPAGPAALRLLAHVRGVPVYVGGGQIQGDEIFAASLPKDKMPAGVLHLTLFDDQQVPRAQRLAFVPDAAPLRITVQPDKPSYGPREAVTVDVDVRTAAGAPAAAELSVAAVATQAGLPATATTDATIESQLLLTSELKGYVENPGYYFRSPTPDTRLALDHLLLTQGWSRFVWRELLGAASPVASYRFPPEQSLTLGGRLVRANQKPVANGTLTLFQQSDKSVNVGQSNANGEFLFLGFPAQDSAKVLLQARTEKGGSNVLIQLNDLWPLPAKPQPLPLQVPATPEVAAYAQRSRRQQVLEQQYRPDSSRSILLRNVTVKGARPAEPARDPRSLHGTADAVLRLKDIPAASSYSDIFQLLQGRVSGVQVSGNGYSYNVQIRGASSITGSSQPLFLLDGMPLADADGLLGIPPVTVERIEVLKGASAAIYGVRAAGGVIAVFTKRGDPDYDFGQEPAAGVVVRQLPAYYRAREFYAPRYEKPAPANRPDPRATTLYWLPRLRVPASGTARFTFYTADQPGTFRVSAEGLSATGQPVVGSSALTVSGR